jgi:hypothetical protein
MTNSSARFIDACIALRQATAFSGACDALRSAKQWQQSAETGFLLGSGLVDHREVRWCKVLAWLLRTDTGVDHKYAASLRMILIGNQLDGAVVGREVSNDDGSQRYDLEITSGRTRVVVEAKVEAPVDLDQLKKYQEDHCARFRESGIELLGLLLILDHRDRPSDHEVIRKSMFEVRYWRKHVADPLSLIANDAESDSFGQSLWCAIAKDFANVIHRYLEDGE